ncbi:hypothetical protein F0562_007939 [Nyssa sinensis]|uniref:Uncharacterized protein n=1 Tax=Nyssa sinensis TaxID=561372 RepID=A0A5J5A9H7_9ASTE|nr:hypothetical protein F0562_007939 [Nyssa sinensis]
MKEIFSVVVEASPSRVVVVVAADRFKPSASSTALSLSPKPGVGRFCGLFGCKASANCGYLALVVSIWQFFGWWDYEKVF